MAVEGGDELPDVGQVLARGPQGDRLVRYSACIELLFAPEHPDFVARIHAAKAAGLDAVEFWKWSNKDLDAVENALRETGMPLAGILCELPVDIVSKR